MHVSNTLDAVDGLCKEDIVRIMVEEGNQRGEELIELVTNFYKNETGKYDLGREGGYS